MSQALISITLATYNGEKYIQEQIASLLAQSYQNFEILIQDDNSSDNTISVIENFKDPRIKIEKNSTNLGYIKNFECVLKRAKGDYIAICDQDDIWREDKLEMLLREIDNNALIYADSLLVDENGNSLNKRLSQKLKNNFISSKEPLNFLYDNAVSAHAALFKRELLEIILPLPQHLYFDQYIALCAASMGGVKYLDKDLVLYRQHQNNTLSQNSKKESSTLSKIEKKLEKKAANNQDILNKIQEIEQIPTLSQKDKELLAKLKSIHTKFFECYFNVDALLFFFKKSNILFTITKKNRVVLSVKKSIGYKLYKVLPIL